MNKSLWLQAALVVSFAFNVATIIMYLRFEPPARPRNHEEFIARVSRHMSQDDRQTLESSFAPFDAEMRDRRIAADQAMDDVRAALTAEPFQADRLSTAMDRAREAHAEAERVFQKAILESAPRLSEAGRHEMMPPRPKDRDGPPPHP